MAGDVASFDVTQIMRYLKTQYHPLQAKF